MKTFLRLTISVALMALFLYWAFAGIDLASMWQSATSVSVGWLVAMIAIILVTSVIRAWRWQVLMRPVAPQVTVWDATLATNILYAVNLVSPIPRAGEAARALSLRWSRGASVSGVLGTIVVERVIDVLWLLILIATSAALLPGQIEHVFPWMRGVAVLALAGSLLAIAAMVAVSIYRDRGIDVVRHLLGRLSDKLADRVAELLGKFIAGLEALRTPSAYLEILLSSALLNAGYGLITWISFAAFGFDDPPLALGAEAALVVMAISSIGVVIPVQGGIGTYHFFYSTALIALFAVPEPSALACATVVHAVSNLTYFAVGAPALLLQRRRHGQRGSLTDELHEATD